MGDGAQERLCQIIADEGKRMSLSDAIDKYKDLHTTTPKPENEEQLDALLVEMANGIPGVKVDKEPTQTYVTWVGCDEPSSTGIDIAEVVESSSPIDAAPDEPINADGEVESAEVDESPPAIKAVKDEPLNTDGADVDNPPSIEIAPDEPANTERSVKSAGVHQSPPSIETATDEPANTDRSVESPKVDQSPPCKITTDEPANTDNESPPVNKPTNTDGVVETAEIDESPPSIETVTARELREQLRQIIKDEGKWITLSNVIDKYEILNSTILEYEGELEDLVRGIPGVRVNNSTAQTYVIWVGVGYVAPAKKAQFLNSSDKHQENVAENVFNTKTTTPDRYACKLCGITNMAIKSFQQHMKGKRHRAALMSTSKASAEVESPTSVENFASSAQATTAVSRPSGPKGKGANEVKIAVRDSCEDLITFQESVGGKSAQRQATDENVFEFQAGFEHLSVSEKAATADEVAASLFHPKRGLNGIQRSKGLSLYGSSASEGQPEGALFGHLFPSSPDEDVGEAVYLNTHEPFCFVTVGVQGAGKSHTSSCVLENCLVPFEPGNIVKLNAPMTSMVLHYDQNTSSICEAAGLLSPNPVVKAKMGRIGHAVGVVPNDKAVILVSPAFYRQRKKFYGDYATVKPLLFRWRSLTADHIKRIMRIESGENQLYVASFLNLLRGYQRQAVVPEFSDFMAQVRKVCNVGSQKGPLDQRIALLESIVAESEKNAALVVDSLDLISCSKEGYHFIIADLTDPLLSKEEANGLFQVLTEQFRTLPTKTGKVLCLDEAHKYMTGEKADGLSEAIVNAARLMRHDGMRLVVSTQSPKALAPELLELVTVAALHHFHSPDWWNYLKMKLPLHEAAFERILTLTSGEAVAFATSHDFSVENIEGSHCLPVRIRPRITEDLGSSRRNS